MVLFLINLKVTEAHTAFESKDGRKDSAVVSPRDHDLLDCCYTGVIRQQGDRCDQYISK